MKRNSLYIALVVSVGFVAACQTTEPVASRPVLQPLAPALEPELAVGSTLVYVRESGEEIRQTIVAIDENGAVTWEASNGWEWTVLHPFAGHVAWTGPDNEGTQSFTGGSMFPLEVGRTIRMSYSGRSTSEGSWSGTRICEVESQQAVDVPAGTFDTYKVVCRQGGNLNRPSRTRTFYYSPEIGDSVLTVHEIHYQNRTERSELVDYAGAVEDLSS